MTADEQDRVWLFLHSGSRGVGNKIAMRHIAIARQRAERERLDLPDRDLAWLDEGTPEFDRYIAELRWAQHFALLNREEMMDRVAGCLAVHMRADETPELERINCHHNFTQRERHFGVDLWVSRKGAIQAKEGPARPDPRLDGDGELRRRRPGQPAVAGLLPARRRAGVLADQGAARPSRGPSWRSRWPASSGGTATSSSTRSPLPTRTWTSVMADAADLVEVRHTLRQLVNVKGD